MTDTDDNVEDVSIDVKEGENDWVLRRSKETII